jgi:Zn-dependent protease
LLDINFAQVFLSFSVLLFSLTVHEMAHAWTADRLGDSTARTRGRVSLNPLVHVDPIGTIVFPLLALIGHLPLLGWAKDVPVNVNRLRNKRRSYLLVAAAGPATNLMVAFIASVALLALPISPQTIGEPNLSAPIATMLSQARFLNVLLAVFNMIPIPPLDGASVMRALLPYRFSGLFSKEQAYSVLLIAALVFVPGAYSTLVLAPTMRVLSWLPTK